MAGSAQSAIMPRLNQLGIRVSSAEEMLQDINQRLESANLFRWRCCYATTSWFWSYTTS